MSSRVPLSPPPHPLGHYLIYVNDIVLEERSPVGGMIPPRQSGEQAAVGVCWHAAPCIPARTRDSWSEGGCTLWGPPPPSRTPPAPVLPWGAPSAPRGCSLPSSWAFRAKLIPLRPRRMQVPDGGSRRMCAGKWSEKQNFPAGFSLILAGVGVFSTLLYFV